MGGLVTLAREVEELAGKFTQQLPAKLTSIENRGTTTLKPRLRTLQALTRTSLENVKMHFRGGTQAILRLRILLTRADGLARAKVAQGIGKR